MEAVFPNAAHMCFPFENAKPWRHSAAMFYSRLREPCCIWKCVGLNLYVYWRQGKRSTWEFIGLFHLT